MNIAMSALGQGAPGTGQGMISGTADASGGDGSSPRSAIVAALQGGSSVLSMMGAIGAGNARAQGLSEEAADARLQGNQDVVSGQSQVVGLRKQLANTIGERNAAYGAGGVDVGQGVAASTRTAIGNSSDLASQGALLSADIMSRRMQTFALADQQEASQAKAAGWINAAGQFASTAFKMLNMG
jgi:hypothetical protein